MPISKLIELLRGSASKNAKRQAVTCGQQSVTYSEYWNRVQQVSSSLKQFGLNRGDRVAIAAAKSVEVIVALVACVDSQAGYCPLDLDSPTIRNRKLLEDLSPKFAICTSEYIESLFYDFEVVGEIENGIFLLKSTKGEIAISPNGLCYILYTSGSTGQPKGVMHSEESVYSFVCWAIERTELNADQVIGCQSPLFFDLSIFDIFAGLAAGAELILFTAEVPRNPRLMAEKLIQHKVSLLYATPSLLQFLIQFADFENQHYPYLKTVISAGEALKLQLVSSYRARWPDLNFFNFYGPTETNVCCSFRVPQTYSGKGQGVSIGEVSPHFIIQYVAQEGTDLYEIQVRGVGVMLGYWSGSSDSGKPKNMLEEIDWYRTGDLVDKQSLSEVYFVSRKDRIIKRRSYRINPLEIESMIESLAKVQRALVYSQEVDGRILLIAKVKISAPAQIAAEEILEYCRKNLPSYMLPDQVNIVNDLPVGPTMKMDINRIRSSDEK